MQLAVMGCHSHTAAGPALLFLYFAASMTTAMLHPAAVPCCCVLQLELDSRPEAFAEVEKVVPKLMSAIDDAHFKVG